MGKTRNHFLRQAGDILTVDGADDNTGGGGQTPADGNGDENGNPLPGDGEDDEKLGEPGIKALRAERKAASDARKRADAAEARLKEIDDADKSDAEKAQERIAELEKKVQAYETEQQRAQSRASVLANKNVPSEWADFVTGDTEDEMNKAADKILANLSSGSQGPLLRPTSGQPGGSIEAGREAAKNFRP